MGSIMTKASKEEEEEDQRVEASKEEEEEEKKVEEDGLKDELPVGVITVEATSSSASTTTPAIAASSSTKSTSSSSSSSSSSSKPILSICTRSCLDMDRWQEDAQMPSLEKFTQLQHLELDKDRYLTRLHESVTTLKDLQTLVLTRCSRLQSLPLSIGQLGKLQVVSMYRTCNNMQN
jgi:hypothetical protein